MKSNKLIILQVLILILFLNINYINASKSFQSKVIFENGSNFNTQVACSTSNVISITFPLMEFKDFGVKLKGTFVGDISAMEGHSMWIVAVCNDEIVQYRVGFFENKLFIQSAGVPSCSNVKIYPFTMNWALPSTPSYCI